MKKNGSSGFDSSVREEIIKLENKFIQAKTDYYRYVIRSEDKTMFSKLIKIPDSWDNYEARAGVHLTDNMKIRLSDIKRRMSWELKLQSLYCIYITSIENTVISVMQQRADDKNDLAETINSINSMIIELESELLNIKHLLLTLAKRSISDFYYLISAYCKFFYKKNFQYETDIKIVLLEFVKIISNQISFSGSIETFKSYERDISGLFQNSSNELGWRLNEFAVKDFLEKENQAARIVEFSRILKELYEYKNSIRNNYNFLKYYYNENDGKLFRLNFIHDSLKQKYNEKVLGKETLMAFEEIRSSFIKYKSTLEIVGIEGFGDERMPYIEVIHLIYKLCKVMEFYYLRNMKYEMLQSLRNDYLFYIEKEIFSIIT